jgi:hypothetical protein
MQRRLESTGINTSALDRIRLARGVVGKASYVAGAAVLGLAVVAWGLRDSTLLVADGALILALFLTYLVGVLWFANKHPGVALLEGAELLQWRQLEITASNPPDEIDRELIEPAPMIEDQKK